MNLSSILKMKLLETDQTLRKICAQYDQIDGYHNLWVVKPGYNARGVGIYVADKLKSIVHTGSKSHQKVVQKYVEESDLIQDGVKYDVR